MGDLLGQALELAEQGVAVFPLDHDKKPRVAGGFHSATTDPEIIKSWNWNGDGLIGAAIPEDTIVIDIDPRNQGNDTLRALKLLGKKFPPTRVVRTRGGGTHRYYKLPKLEGKKIQHQVGLGIDVKISGKGYIVVPPSPGYELVMDVKASKAPDWLVEEIVVDEEPQTVDDPSPPKYFEWEEGTRYGLRALERELETLSSVREGGRNNALNKATYSLAQLSAGGELDEEAAIRALDTTAHQIGLDTDEIHETIKQGWSAGLKMPRQAPEREETKSYETFLAEKQAADDDDFYWLDWATDEPDPPYYLYPVIPKHAFVIVYGPTESSKSMAFVGLAAQASHRDIKSSVYSLENPSHVDRHRTRRLAPDPDHFRITNQYIDLHDVRQLNDLVERNRPGGHGSWPDGRGTDWLIIDTYSHAFNSSREETNARAIEFARRVRYIMHEVGCSVILLDHTGYMQPGEPRDASAKRQQVDVAIMMDRTVEWQPGKPAVCTMTNKKSARFGNPFHIVCRIKDTATGGLEINLDPQLGGPLRWEDAS